MTIVMLIGLPGSGKSTKAKEYESLGYVIHSSDAIRNELNLHSLNDTQKVFDILHERIIEDIKLGKDIVYDSTNLTRKRRMSFLEMIKNFKCIRICEVMLTSIEICRERNSKRISYSRVTDKEYDILIDRFNFPMSDEGWDIIKLNMNDDKLEVT